MGTYIDQQWDIACDLQACAIEYSQQPYAYHVAEYYDWNASQFAATLPIINPEFD